MKSDDTCLFDDPTTPGYVRDLLQAGRRANAEYDVERGLAKHLAAISGAPVAHWAPSTAASVATKAWPSWIGFAAMPLAAASVAGLLWVYAADRPAPAANGASGSAIAATSAEPARAPMVNAAPAAAHPAAERDERDDSEARPERRRSGVRPSAARSRAASNARATEDGEFEGVAIGGSDTAIDTRSGDGVTKLRASVEPSVASAESRPVQNRAHPSAAAADRAVEAPARAAEAEPARSETEAAAKPAPVIDESRLEREMQMLAVTQRVLTSDPARALRLSEQGEREFRGSMFSAERRQLGLLALVKLGRLDEARRAGRPFLARYPKAPWSERLRRALATGVVE